MNQLILGDNLEIMRKMDAETIDLIYLDPPFFSNRNYEVIWGDKGEVRSFEDRWSGGIDHYIAWLKERVAEMHRLLKPTGSIYLHCDWHANSYIRVYILDKIFGEDKFRNEIFWRRTNPKGLAFTKFARNIDTIYLFSKESNNFKWHPQYKKYEEDKVNNQYSLIDENGRRYQLTSLLNPNKNRPNLTYEFKGVIKVWRWTEERMKEADLNGMIVVPRNGKGIPRFKRYLDEQEGIPVDNLWEDIPNIQGGSQEKIGYPTQKPEKLLNRIILASSNEGDLVFDPFVGGGTTVVVAEKLKRKWLGIDQSVQAVKVSEMRLNNAQNLFSAPFSVTLHKYDYDTLRYKDAFEFEKWIVEQFGGIANVHQRGDMGMDGKTREGVPIQVKRSDNIGRNVIDNFGSACKRFDNNLFEKNKVGGNPVGYIIAFSFAKGTIQEAARLRNEENIIIKLVSVEEIVPIAKKPKLLVKINDLGVVSKPVENPLTPLEQGGTGEVIPLSQRGTKGVSLREIEFIAVGESEAGIEFYSWDFEYSEEATREHAPLFRASIMLDKEGKQTHKFKPGTHNIAVKAVDNEGLEAIEVVKVKVNGEVETV
ncbi:MAG: Mtase protein [Ignavibacteria bacterium]|nr:Mtase protein [Ignavibacteria bacterium]